MPPEASPLPVPGSLTAAISDDPPRALRQRTFGLRTRLTLSCTAVAGVAIVIGVCWWLGVGRSAFENGEMERLAASAGVAAVLLLGASLVIGHYATRPIVRFISAARAITEGRAPAGIDTTGADELGVLNRAFQAMAVSLAARQETKRRQAVAQFAATVAHDINNLLTVILGNAEIVADGLPSDHALRAEVDAIRAGSRRTAQVARRFLALVRSRPEQHRQLDLAALVHETVHSSRTAMPPPVRLLADVTPEAFFCEGNESLLSSALLNLIINGRDAIRGRGTVTVQLRRVSLPGAPAGARGSDLAPGEHAEITVIDTGSGMDEATQARLFEPFFTTKPGGRGTGLGLSAVLETVMAHHGAVRISSRTGQGTSVTVWLPLVAAPPCEMEEDEVALPPGLRVLVADDEPFVLQVLERSLVVSGAKATGASSYSETREALEDPAQLDAVVLDVVMPGGSGLTLAERLRKCSPRIAIVLHSGFFTAADEERVHALRAVPLRKPSTREELVRAVLEAQRLTSTDAPKALHAIER